MDDSLILLTGFRFPDHWKVQEWLSETEYGDEFTLVLAEVTTSAWNGGPGTTSLTTPALEPKTDEAKFYWALRGASLRAETAEKLEQIILDFHKK